MFWVLVPILLIYHDYIKNPIDLLYFQKPLRPLLGMKNAIIDLLFYRKFYDVNDYDGLGRIKLNFEKIARSYRENRKSKKYYFHDLDSWFPECKNYYYHKLEDFPFIDLLVRTIPCVTSGHISVMEGKYVLPAHRAEANDELRYHLTIEGTSELETDSGLHVHEPGEEFLFDHARYHKVDKYCEGKRVVLILDVKRF